MALRYDETTEDMRIRHLPTGRLAIIGLKKHGTIVIVDQYGHVETLNKTDIEDWIEA